MGTGEGAQAYGYGLYFAGKKDIAEWYRKNLSGIKPEYKPSGYDVTAWWNQAEKLYPNDKPRQEAWHALAQKSDWSDPAAVAQWGKESAYSEESRAVVDSVVSDIYNKGQLYEVDIPEDTEMLLWDKPLSEQPASVNKAVQKVERDRLVSIMKQRINARAERVKNGENTDAVDRQIEVLREEIDAFNLPLGGTGERYYKSLSQKLGGDKAASEYLASLGIKGIKYLDGTSRTSGEGSYNYVVFSGDDVSITDTAYMGTKDQTETEAFKKWFGASKVVDSDGKPLRVFHGTTADFSEFNPLKTGSASDAGWYGDGFYFTPDPKEAGEGYAFKESGSNVMPVYLSIKNPYDWRSENKKGLTQNAVQASLEKRAELQARGFDGVFVYEDKLQLGKDQKLTDEQKRLFSSNENSMADVFGWDFVENSLRRKEWDFNVISMSYGYEFAQSLPKSTRTLKEIVAFRPEQIKSATGNRGTFDPEDADISHFGEAAIEQIKAFDVKTAPKNTWAHYRGMALQALGRRQIVDLYAEELPMLEHYNDLVQRMDADKNEAGAEADQLVRRWANLDERAMVGVGPLKHPAGPAKYPGMELKLAELMHDATLAQIDPDKALPAGYSKTEYIRLKAKFEALSPAAKEAFRQARDMYADHYTAVQKAIKDRIERSEMSPSQKKQIMAQMDEKLFRQLQGVYFPLARFGQYVIVVKDANGEVKNVTRAETVNEAEKARKELLKAFPAHMGNTVGKVLKQAEFNAGRDAVGKGFMADLMNVLDEKGVNDELRDTVAQLYLSSLPDLSWAKHGIHRKGTPGFSQDARRAFAQNMFHGARYLAKLRYSDQLQDELAKMQDHIKDYEGVDEYDSVQAQQVVDEMVKRHEFMMNPNSSPVSTALTSFGFLFHMGCLFIHI
jgi:mRNA-degrading endonuclease HigB of HigAB toxin-antitoxin module